MERAERTGFGIAFVAHAALLAALSLGLLTKSKPLPPLNEPMDVQLVDAVGLQSAAPAVAQEPPATRQAPEAGPPEEAAPEPDPAPAPEPAPPPPAPKPQPKPEPAPKPAPPKEAAKPRPKPTPAKPTPPKPVVEKPAKPSPAKPAGKPAAKPAAKPSTAKGAPAKTPPVDKPGKGEGKRTSGGLLGDNFLEGITPEKSAGKGKAPRAAAISALAMNGLAQAIKRQIQPCYDLGSLAGTPAMSIVTVLELRFNRDGSVAGTPRLIEQTGIDGSNGSYARQIADVGRRAVVRCAPLKLPAELYEGGWDELNFRFTPGQMQ